MIKSLLAMLGFGHKVKKEIVVNAESLEVRVAVLEEGNLEEFFIERESEDRVVGSIFKGRVQNLEDGLQAAFIDIGQKKNAFVHFWDMIPEDATRLEAEEGVQNVRPQNARKLTAAEIAKRYPIGSDIVVQVTKGAIGTKGPRVTASLSIPGRYLVMMPGCSLKGVSRKIEDDKERARLKAILARLPVPPGIGIIVRTAGAGARKVSFVRDLRGLLDIWKQIDTGLREKPAPARLYQEPDLVERTIRDALTEDIDRVVIDNKEVFEQIRDNVGRISRRSKNRIKLYEGEAPIFEHFAVERQLENCFRRKVWLKSGGYLVFDETEALVAIDINTGRHKGGQSQEESILQVNLESAVEIARQLRLRNVGGLVVIDFIDMKQKRNQQQVYRALRDALKHDRARTNVLPISQLGLVEMTRQRVEESIRSSTYSDCPYCRGRGKVKNLLSMSVAIQRQIAAQMRRRHDKEFSLKITVHPAVLERLRKEDEQVLVGMMQKYGSRLSFAADPQQHVEDFKIANAGTGEELFTTVERLTGNA